MCLVDRGRARAAPDDAQRVDGALVDRHRLCLLEIEVTTQVGRGRGAHQHISGASRPMQTSCEHRRVTGGGVVHPKVVADGAHDDRTGVDPDPDVDLGSLLHRECGKRGAACVVLVGDRGAEEGHEAVAEELVDRALVAVDLGEGEGEEAVDDPVIFLRASLRRQLGRADDVAEEDAHLFPFALDRAADRENLVTQMAGRVGRRGRGRLDGMPALRAELGVLGQVRSAVVALAADEQGAGDDGRDLAATSPGRLVVLRRRLRAASVSCEALDLGVRAAGRAAEDLEIDGLGLRRRVGAELVGEEAPAALVHAECLGRVAGGDVRLHQRAVAGLAEGLEIGDLGRISDCVPELPLGERRIAQAFERTHEDVTEVAPLILDPPSVLAGQKHPPSKLGSPSRPAPEPRRDPPRRAPPLPARAPSPPRRRRSRRRRAT